MKTKIDLVEIGIGNTGSVKRCLERLGAEFRTVNSVNQPDGSRPLVLPGVGQFGSVMQALQQNNLDVCLRNLILGGTPYLGICVGMQVLFEGSEESANVPGLGLLRGNVVRFKKGKIPQIGWNLIQPMDTSLTEGYVYFVNSYYPEPKDQTIISYAAEYYDRFCAAIKSKNITAVQFHPEKSADFGSQFLRGWLNSVN